MEQKKPTFPPKNPKKPTSDDGTPSQSSWAPSAQLAELIDAAMRACDHWQDGPQAREEMRRECMETPEHLRADLLTHFCAAYGGGVVDSSLDAAAGQQPRGP